MNLLSKIQTIQYKKFVQQIFFVINVTRNKNLHIFSIYFLC